MPEDKALLKNIFALLLAEMQETPEGLKTFAGDWDLEHSNLCRLTRENPNSRIITIKQLCEKRGQKFWEVIKQAQEMLDEQDKNAKQVLEEGKEG